MSFDQDQSEEVTMAAADLAQLVAERDALKKALQFYAKPEIYKPHPHGPAFDRRDLSYHAIAALAAVGATEPCSESSPNGDQKTTAE